MREPQTNTQGFVVFLDSLSHKLLKYLIAILSKNNKPGTCSVAGIQHRLLLFGKAVNLRAI